MTKKEVINDLYLLEKILHTHYCISTPVCLKYAIKYLEEEENILSEEEIDKLFFWNKEEE